MSDLERLKALILEVATCKDSDDFNGVVDNILVLTRRSWECRKYVRDVGYARITDLLALNPNVPDIVRVSMYVIGILDNSPEEPPITNPN